jgi:hypothetical protein
MYLWGVFVNNITEDIKLILYQFTKVMKEGLLMKVSLASVYDKSGQDVSLSSHYTNRL